MVFGVVDVASRICWTAGLAGVSLVVVLHCMSSDAVGSSITDQVAVAVRRLVYVSPGARETML